MCSGFATNIYKPGIADSSYATEASIKCNLEETDAQFLVGGQKEGLLKSRFQTD